MTMFPLGNTLLGWVRYKHELELSLVLLLLQWPHCYLPADFYGFLQGPGECRVCCHDSHTEPYGPVSD